MTLETLLKTHEALKAKGLRLNNDDIHTRIGVLDGLIDIFIELDSEYEENKSQLDNIMDTEHILLKEQEGGSDTIVKGKVRKKYTDSLTTLAVMKKQRNIAKLKQDSVEHYINLAKRVVQ